MKKIKFIVLSCFLVSFSNAQNIYTADGTISANRTVTMNAKNLTFNPTNATSQFFVNGSTGFLGLGTATPSSRFHLANGDAAITSGRLVFGTVANYEDATSQWGIKSDKPFVIAGERPFIKIRSTIVGATRWLDLAIAANDYAFSHVAKKGDMILRTYTPGSMIFNCEGTGDIKFTTIADNLPSTVSKVQMLIDKNGNIGIGTQTPDAKLAVNGLIHSKEVKVDLINWPDYVFESDYNLPTLQEVEEHIKSKGHLKDIPSAKEAEADGVKLGEMNKLLLQKVEELTLYIIQMNKELEEVKSQLKKN